MIRPSAHGEHAMEMHLHWDSCWWCIACTHNAYRSSDEHNMQSSMKDAPPLNFTKEESADVSIDKKNQEYQRSYLRHGTKGLDYCLH